MNNLPDFITNRVDKFYTDRVQNTWSGRHMLDGKPTTENSVLVNHNDYLCLGNNPRVIEAQTKAIQDQGNGVVMSSIFQRGMTPQRAFELRLAAHIGMQDGIVTQSGWCANTGLVQTIASPETVVYIDFMAHMSLWEGARIAGAKIVPFAHNDVTHLHRKLKQHGQGIILVDSQYSTDGSICPLGQVCDLSNEFGCALVVDESHSLGIIGPNGEGLVAYRELIDSVHFITASLAKAFAGRGGFIACDSRFRKYFDYVSFPQIFSSCVMPSDIAGFNAALTIIQNEPQRRRRLRDISYKLATGLKSLGYPICETYISQIIVLEAGPEPATMQLRDAMERYDIIGAVFCAPATPKNRSLLRLSLNCGLSDDDVNRILYAATAIRDEVKLSEWPATRRATR